MEVPERMVLTERGTTIHQLAARKAAQDLEESRRWVFDDANKIADVQNLAEREAARLGETFQVVNKWCSFVAVSSNDGKEIFIRNTTLQPDLPTNTPYGWQVLPPRVVGPLRAENPFLRAPPLAARMGNISRTTAETRSILAMARFSSRGQSSSPRRQSRKCFQRSRHYYNCSTNISSKSQPDKGSCFDRPSMF